MDLRVPSGWFFLLAGIILVAVGVIHAPTAPLTEVNVNLYTGAVLALFGGTMLWLARKQPL
ncbi:MAG TPA: hypothetical protein VES20_20760 [Bryobacteraceae bacterium]|nr:hypothetical protein [Bryobacteraceae bacterium]